jgi:hypothetical protein
MERIKLIAARLTPIAFAVFTLTPDAMRVMSVLWWGSGGK